MESTKVQEVLVCIHLMEKIHLHVGDSFAEVAADLLQMHQAAVGTAQQPYVAQMNLCLLDTLGKQYVAMVEIASQQLLACLRREAVQGHLPFTEDETDAIPF